MMAATARTTPKTYANLADAGFGAMFPSGLRGTLVPVPVLVPVCRTFRGANREKCVSYFTLIAMIILMETIKDLYARWDFSRAQRGKGRLLAVLETPSLPHCPGV